MKQVIRLIIIMRQKKRFHSVKNKFLIYTLSVYHAGWKNPVKKKAAFVLTNSYLYSDYHVVKEITKFHC